MTATAADDDGNTVADDDSAIVTFIDLLPAIGVTKTPSTGSVAEPGGIVTFTVVVENTGPEDVTITSLDDDVFGDLLDPVNPAVSANTCPALAGPLTVGSAVTCTFDATVSGDASGPDHRNTVTAGAVDDEGNPASAADDAVVAFTDVPPTATVSKTPNPGSLAEPGGLVTFDIVVVNTTVEPLTLTALDDSEFGDLLDPTNPRVIDSTCSTQPTVIPAGGAFACTFDAVLTGDASGPPHTNTVTARLVDDDGNTVDESDDAVVPYDDALPNISVSKTPSVGSVTEPGGSVTFTVDVTASPTEPLTLTALTDDVYGDLLDPLNPAVTANTCPSLATIAAGATVSCSFAAFVAGNAGDPDHVNTVTATARPPSRRRRS